MMTMASARVGALLLLGCVHTASPWHLTRPPAYWVGAHTSGRPVSPVFLLAAGEMSALTIEGVTLASSCDVRRMVEASEDLSRYDSTGVRKVKPLHVVKALAAQPAVEWDAAVAVDRRLGSGEARPHVSTRLLRLVLLSTTLLSAKDAAKGQADRDLVSTFIARGEPVATFEEERGLPRGAMARILRQLLPPGTVRQQQLARNKWVSKYGDRALLEERVRQAFTSSGHSSERTSRSLGVPRHVVATIVRDAGLAHLKLAEMNARTRAGRRAYSDEEMRAAMRAAAAAATSLPPRRFPTAYSYFMKDFYARLAAARSGGAGDSSGLTSSSCGAAWRALSVEEREAYEARRAADFAQYGQVAEKEEAEAEAIQRRPVSGGGEAAAGGEKKGDLLLILTVKQYKTWFARQLANGRHKVPHSHTIMRRYCTWHDACHDAGLKPSAETWRKREGFGTEKFTDAEMMEAVAEYVAHADAHGRKATLNGRSDGGYQGWAKEMNARGKVTPKVEVLRTRLMGVRREYATWAEMVRHTREQATAV